MNINYFNLKQLYITKKSIFVEGQECKNINVYIYIYIYILRGKHHELNKHLHLRF